MPAAYHAAASFIEGLRPSRGNMMSDSRPSTSIFWCAVRLPQPSPLPPELELDELLPPELPPELPPDDPPELPPEPLPPLPPSDPPPPKMLPMMPQSYHRSLLWISLWQLAQTTSHF